MLVIKKKTVIHYISAALLGDFGAMCVAGGVYCYANRNVPVSSRTAAISKP